jgi:hypothetical protein
MFMKLRYRLQESGKAINEKIRLYVKVGQAVISAKAEGRDPFQAIEQSILSPATLLCPELSASFCVS